MPVKRRLPKRRHADLVEWKIVFLETGRLMDVPERDEFEAGFEWKHGRRCGGVYGDPVRDAWSVHGDRILDEWIHRHPGTRPFAWWQYDAPVPRQGNESEADYLSRCNLLFESERGAVCNTNVQST